MTKVVGLTGGIGSGKTTVARLLAELGAVVIDADAIVHELQARGSPLLGEIASAFGEQFLTPAGDLDREALGALVFRDPQARERLNALVHPRVGAEMLRRLASARERGAALVVLDIPLLFEGRRAGTGTASLVPLDATVLVYAPEELQVERQVQRDGRARDEALRRVRAQMPLEEKKALADVVIDNSGSREETERQVRRFYESITGACAEGP
jgi:dephospho-CoA kinase